jgi:hypothetical protein
MTKKVYVHITTPIMRAINNTHLHPSNQKPDVSPFKSVPENLSTCSNSPSCLVDSTRIVYESAGSPLTCRVRCVIKRPSIVHCGPKPPEMMANRFQIVHSIAFEVFEGRKRQLEGEQHFLNFLNLRDFRTATNAWDKNFRNDCILIMNRRKQWA